MLRPGKCAFVLLFAAMVLLAVAASRGFEYDEAYSVLVTSPDPRPHWPDEIFRVSEARHFFTAHAPALAIAEALRRTDVHPPLYFWALSLWRDIAGDGLFVMRLLSVAFALGSLALLAAIALHAGISPPTSMLLTIGSYGFTYTGAIARGFSLALMLALAGVLAALRADRTRDAFPAALAGLLFGAATLSNYLASFVCLATLAWMMAACRRHPRLWLAAMAGYAAALPSVLWFFLAQRDSRARQFPPFDPLAAALRLARYGAADLLGGLPLYVAAPMRLTAGIALAVLGAALAGVIMIRWEHIAARRFRWLFLLAALAPPLGLMALGAVFNNTPIELRYLSFSTPFLALLLAGALEGGRLRQAMRWVLIAAQMLALAGLALHPATMQPFRAAGRQAMAVGGPDAVILASLGNDGVGAVAPLIAELPDRARIKLVGGGQEAAILRALPEGTQVVELRLDPDAASRESLGRLDRAFAAGGWLRGTATPLAAAYDKH